MNLASSYPHASHREGLLLCLQWFVCLGVTIALSILGGWHVYLISVSETTIEFYTNKRDARKMRKEGKVRIKKKLVFVGNLHCCGGIGYAIVLLLQVYN